MTTSKVTHSPIWKLLYIRLQTKMGCCQSMKLILWLSELEMNSKSTSALLKHQRLKENKHCSDKANLMTKSPSKVQGKSQCHLGQQKCMQCGGLWMCLRFATYTSFWEMTTLEVKALFQGNSDLLVLPSATYFTNKLQFLPGL